MQKSDRRPGMSHPLGKLSLTTLDFSQGPRLHLEFQRLVDDYIEHTYARR